jgi:superfamily II DNA or RNA helicase
MSQAALFRQESPGIQLRYYQRDALDRVMSGIASGEHSQLVVMATGLGKTVVFAGLIQQFPGNVLVVAHRDELIGQAARHIEAATGEPVEIEQAGWESYKARIVVGSVQSLRRPRRLERLGKDRFQLVIVDEAHHATAPSYRTVMDWFSCPVVGFTATPDRGDEKALGKVFDSVAYAMDIQDGIEQGWLVPFEGHRIVLDDIKLDNISKTAGDLAAYELDEAMVASVKGIVHESVRLAPDRQGIAFFPGVKSAELAMLEFNTVRSDMACFISGETDPEERKQIVKDFRRGRYQILSNCQVATEGFDVPEASLIIQGRPTLSRSLYTQMIGRGGRPLAGTVDPYPEPFAAATRRSAIQGSLKPNCLILDCVGNSTRHSLIGPEDALGGNFDPDVVELAKKKAKQNGGDPLKALKSAQAEIKAMMQQTKATVKATVSRFDPFAVLGVSFTDEDRYAQRFGLKPATENQRAVLIKRGMTDKDMEGLSKSAASRLLDEMSKRQHVGLASFKQVRTLEKFGLQSAKTATFERASAGLTYIAQQGWGKGGIDPKKLWSLVLGPRQSGDE